MQKQITRRVLMFHGNGMQIKEPKVHLLSDIPCDQTTGNFVLKLVTAYSTWVAHTSDRKCILLQKVKKAWHDCHMINYLRPQHAIRPGECDPAVAFVRTFLHLVSTAVILGQHSPRMVKGMTDTQNLSFHLQFMFNFRINFQGEIAQLELFKGD